MSTTVTLNIPDIYCHHCTDTIARETMELPGVIKVEGKSESQDRDFHP